MSSFTTADISWLEWPSGIESEAKIVVFVIEDTKNATLGWSTLRDDLLPSLILSLARLSSDEEVRQCAVEINYSLPKASSATCPCAHMFWTQISSRRFESYVCFHAIFPRDKVF